MNIGFDAKRAFFNKSGLGNYSRSILQLLSNYYPENNYFLYTPKAPTHADFINNSNLHVKTPRKRIHRVLNAYWRSYKLPGEFKYDGIDLFHGLSNELPVDISKSSVKSIVTIHDLIFMRYPSLYNRIDKWIYEKKFKTSSRKADTVIAVSKQTKEDLVHFFNIDEKKIEVVYQGCDSIFYESKPEEEKEHIRQKHGLPKTFLLYVGTIEERKNALSIVKALHKGGIDIPLVIIGKSTPYKKTIQQYIAENKVKNAIQFYSEIPFEELPAIYQLAKAFVYPSVFEGFGIPILEALNSQTPVITTRGGCFHETGGSHSLYVDPLNTEEIADAIRSVLYNEDLRKRMIEKGYEHAMKFRDEYVAKSMIDVYLRTIDK
ncbi:MAG: glycosyltransferase family 4 protein [Bacteroidales bacterium]